MEAPRTVVPNNPRGRIWMWLGALLLVVGLIGHLLAAHVMGGSRVAYTHHILGFVFLSVVCGAVIAGAIWRFWKGRHDITILTLGVSQAILGLLIYAGQR